MKKSKRLAVFTTYGQSKKQLIKMVWILEKELKELKEKYENRT